MKDNRRLCSISRLEWFVTDNYLREDRNDQSTRYLWRPIWSKELLDDTPEKVQSSSLHFGSKTLNYLELIVMADFPYSCWNKNELNAE